MTDTAAVTWTKFYWANLKKNGLVFPSIDLFFTGAGHLSEKASGQLVVLGGARTSDEASPFSEITLIVPLGAVATGTLSQRATDDTVGLPRVPFRLVVLDQTNIETLLRAVEECQPHSAIIVLGTAKFVADGVTPRSLEVGSKLALPEDFWAPQLAHLASRLESVNVTSSSYIVLEAGETYPGRPEHRNLFDAISTLAIVTDDSESRTNQVLAEQSSAWSKLISAGRIGSALRMVEDLPAHFDGDKPHLRIQVLRAANLAGQALDEIERLDLSRATPSAMLRTAQTAVEAGGVVLARKLLESVVPHLRSVAEFEVALQVARMLDSKGLATSIEDKYHHRFPLESTLRRRSVQSLISAGMFGDALSMIPVNAETAIIREAVEFCNLHLPRDGFPDYIAIKVAIEDGGPFKHIAFDWLVDDALRKGLVIHAFELVFGDLRPRKGQEIGDRAFSVLHEVAMARGADGKMLIAEDRVNSAIRDLLAFVAANPDQPHARFKLESLLSRQIAGTNGTAVLLHELVNQRVVKRFFDRSPPEDDVPLEEVEVALKRLFAVVLAEGTVVAGRLQLPSELILERPDAVLAATTIELERILQTPLRMVGGVQDALLWLSVVMMLAPHTSSPDVDLELARQVGARLVMDGHVQNARNLIDVVFLGTAAHASARRKRHTWFVVADIYSRLKQLHEGLMALVCGTRVVCDVSTAEALQEADVSTRLLRDQGFAELAFLFHETAGRLLREIGQFESQSHVHEFVGFTLEMQVLQRRKPSAEAVTELMHRVAANGRSVLERGIAPQPVAMLLGQLASFSEQSGIRVPEDVRDILDKLAGNLNGRASTLFQQVATLRPTPEGLLELHRSMEPARYAKDAAFDAGPAAVGARRLLTAGSSQSPRTTAFVLELLSDRAISLPGWQTTPTPLPHIQSVNEVGDFAVELSRGELDVVMIGLDETGAAVAVLAREGKLHETKFLSSVEFSGVGFLHWTRDYPYRYGIDEETPNIFHVSTEGLNFPFELVRTTAVISAVRLQQLTPTLYRVGDDLAGELQPIFAAPSLSWLHTAILRPSSSVHRTTAWISQDEREGYTLAMIKDRLEETLRNHDVHLDTGNELPDGFWGAELSIVVAHGSVLPEGKYFQRVTNEGYLRVTTEDFARAFKNVGVVVLFVCSAGRTDMAPEGETTHGLARELLAQGCSTVIAAPWPLDARVAYHWLPTFFDAWARGQTASKSAFVANQNVRSNFGSKLANCMAMTVFGNGLRTRHA